MSSTDLCTQLLVARNAHEFPARPRGAYFSGAMYSYSESGTVSQQVLRKIKIRLMTRCDMIGKLSD